jgi:hypothetical protein
VEVADYPLSDRIEILWLEDGDRDLKPRKSVSGLTASDHLASMATAVKRRAKTHSRPESLARPSLLPTILLGQCPPLQKVAGRQLF